MTEQPTSLHGRRVLVVGAHPDDIEFGAAGTVARWTGEGADVRYVLVTSGQRGVQDSRQDPHEFGELRQKEAREAAAICGVTDVTYLGYMDSEVDDNRALRRALSRQYRIHRPHRLLTMHPAQILGGTFINHPDHRAVASAILDVVLTGGSTAAIHPELLHDEGLEPWRELEDIWLMGPGADTVAVDVTGTWEKKVAALQAHRSQVAQIPFDLRSMITDRLREVGKAHGLEYAETFDVINRRPPQAPDEPTEAEA